MFSLKALLLFVFSAYSFSGIYIEPFLGYKAGSSTTTVSNAGPLNGEYKYALTGTAYGARAGYKKLLLSGGLSYELGSLKEKADSDIAKSIASENDKYDTTFAGAFLGVHLPFVRAYATYYFSVELEDTNGSDKGSESSGNGYGLGVGTTFFPFIALNLEYRKFEIDKLVDENGVVTNYPTSTQTVIDGSEILITVSLPLDL